jgi:hypothetical protein
MLQRGFVTEFILSTFAVIRVFFRSRSDTALEILALRQQVAVLKRKRPRPPVTAIDRLFWTALRRLWSRWSEVSRHRQTRDGHRLAPRSVSIGAGVPAAKVADRRSRRRYVS